MLSGQVLEIALSPDRIESIASAFNGDSPTTITYIAPWVDRSVQPSSTDLVLSHGVMHYFTELEKVYGVIYEWLKPGGVMSHQINFSGLQFARDEWNTHWSREH